jgi:hypothetical protein
VFDMPLSRSSKIWGGLIVGGVALGAAAVAYARYLRPRHLRWGATDQEVNGVWPGDEISPAATSICTHALTINAPIDKVWPWIVQIGQDRAGFYSYSWLENLVGADIHNLDRIVAEFQERKVGDTVWLAPKHRYAGQARQVVARLDSGEAMVLVSPNDYDVLFEGGTAKGSWAFILRAIDDHTTRFIMRGRGSPVGALQQAIDRTVFEPAHFIMERRMMLSIKDLAEKHYMTRLADQETVVPA